MSNLSGERTIEEVIKLFKQVKRIVVDSLLTYEKVFKKVFLRNHK